MYCNLIFFPKISSQSKTGRTRGRLTKDLILYPNAFMETKLAKILLLIKHVITGLAWHFTECQASFPIFKCFLNDIPIKTRQLTSSVFIVFNYWLTFRAISGGCIDGTLGRFFKQLRRRQLRKRHLKSGLASHLSYLVRFVKSWQIFPEFNSKGLCQSKGKKKKVVVLCSRPHNK